MPRYQLWSRLSRPAYRGRRNHHGEINPPSYRPPPNVRNTRHVMSSCWRANPTNASTDDISCLSSSPALPPAPERIPNMRGSPDSASPPPAREKSPHRAGVAVFLPPLFPPPPTPIVKERGGGEGKKKGGEPRM